jgi:hypothetical protein
MNKAEEIRERTYLKFFRDDEQFKGRSYRLRDNYIFHTDEAYDSVDYYLRTGVKP